MRGRRTPADLHPFTMEPDLVKFEKTTFRHYLNILQTAAR